LISCSSSIGQQIFYNSGDPENFDCTTAWISPILYIIFKRQVRETYVKMSIKKNSTLTITHFDFTYKSPLKNTQFYVF